MTDPRVSVHSVTFLGASVDEMRDLWRDLGVSRLSLIDAQLDDPELADVITAEGYSVETVFHLFTTPDALHRRIDDAARVGARAVYMLTGGRGKASWGEAAERFCSVVAPCLEHADRAGVTLAIENASALYADLHIAHTLADTLELAEMAGLGICVDLFHCWAEAHLDALVERAMPRLQMIQLSDYVLGDRALPARAVPGDGVVPVEAFLGRAIAAGYRHGVDLELIGPRIEQEGGLAAARRGCEVVSEMLSRIDTGGDRGIR